MYLTAKSRLDHWMGDFIFFFLPSPSFRYWRHELMENCEAEAKFYKAVRSILGLP